MTIIVEYSLVLLLEIYTSPSHTHTPGFYVAIYFPHSLWVRPGLSKLSLMISWETALLDMQPIALEHWGLIAMYSQLLARLFAHVVYIMQQPTRVLAFEIEFDSKTLLAIVTDGW